MNETISLEVKHAAGRVRQGLSQDAFRALFPALSDLTHAASCSQGALSAQVLTALHEYTSSLRTRGASWDAWMHQVELARMRFADLIGADATQVAVVSCASEAAFQVASSLTWADSPGLVTTEAEFPSIAHVWLGQRVNGAAVDFVPGTETVPSEGYARRITEQTHLVSVPMVGFRNGARFPVAEVASLAHRAGARVFVDAYQAAGVMPIDVSELDCDYLAAGALKYVLGVPGAAFLYVREGIDHERDPQLTGWFGRKAPYSFDPRTLDFPAGASRFEVGTPSIPAFYAAAAALELISEVDMAAAFSHVATLTAEMSGLLDEAGESLASPLSAESRGPQVALREHHADRLASWLQAQHRIVTAPRGDILRISFHYYNDMRDVAVIADAVREYRRSAAG